MRRFLPPALLAGALLFLLWELYAVIQWLQQAGSLGAAFDHVRRAVGSDWMALIVVSDHLIIAGTVLIALLIDAARQGWSAPRPSSSLSDLLRSARRHCWHISPGD
jgi:hypothetical protein